MHQIWCWQQTLFKRNVIIYGENGSENKLLLMFNDFIFILCSRKDLEKERNPKQWKITWCPVMTNYMWNYFKNSSI